MRGGDDGESADGSDLPELKHLHNFVPEYSDAKCVDGGAPKFRFEAVGSDYFPWRNLTELVVAIWAILHRRSRKSLQMLLDMLRFVDSRGRGFD